jgi:hypothetical protein
MSITHGGRAINEKRVRTSNSSHLAPDAIMTGVIGLAVLLSGLVVVVRAGLGGALAEPVVRIFSFDHTATLGLIEIGIGLCLLASASASSRPAEMFFGVLLGIGGFVGAVQSDSFDKTLALEPAMGWIAVIAGLVIVAAVLFMPRYDKQSTSLTQD